MVLSHLGWGCKPQHCRTYRWRCWGSHPNLRPGVSPCRGGKLLHRCNTHQPNWYSRACAYL